MVGFPCAVSFYFFSVTLPKFGTKLKLRCYGAYTTKTENTTTTYPDVRNSSEFFFLRAKQEMATTWLIFCLGIVYSVQRSQSSGILPVKATHHNNSALHQVLEALAATYPNITRLYSIGKSYQGKELWVLEITKNPGRHIPGKPEFKYVANMHGNEVVGRELLLLFADYLCSNYGSNDRVTRLVDTTRIHLLPSMNPDGWESSNEGDCSSVRGRFNANGVDLNRNFPDPYDGQRNELQPETQAVMNWIHQEPFVLSANLHGGTLVVNYPFDNLPNELKRSGSRVYYSSPDDDIFVSIAKVYSKTHPTMHIGHPKCPIQRNERFADGITNGAAWYPISGGMQDYNYYKTYGIYPGHISFSF